MVGTISDNFIPSTKSKVGGSNEMLGLGRSRYWRCIKFKKAKLLAESYQNSISSRPSYNNEQGMHYTSYWYEKYNFSIPWQPASFKWTENVYLYLTGEQTCDKSVDQPAEMWLKYIFIRQICRSTSILYKEEE